MLVEDRTPAESTPREGQRIAGVAFFSHRLSLAYRHLPPRTGIEGAFVQAKQGWSSDPEVAVNIFGQRCGMPHLPLCGSSPAERLPA